MELNKDEILEVAKEVIQEKKIDRLTNLFGYLPIDIRSFYKCFPIGSEKHNLLIELIKDNEHSEIEN